MPTSPAWSCHPAAQQLADESVPVEDLAITSRLCPRENSTQSSVGAPLFSPETSQAASTRQLFALQRRPLSWPGPLYGLLRPSVVWGDFVQQRIPLVLSSQRNLCLHIADAKHMANRIGLPLQVPRQRLLIPGPRGHGRLLALVTLLHLLVLVGATRRGLHWTPVPARCLFVASLGPGAKTTTDCNGELVVLYSVLLGDANGSRLCLAEPSLRDGTEKNRCVRAKRH
ncbi:uncharacterized protein BDZ83DRAFT_148937 [Colletotrichum acutatum]|uniref:Uncharacterized protein n=1 Tax=Glomerella acutata TaxID=27357 RepID=A0AAD8UTB4_GLOAC|nr:uncharacterized protein BDZ83DRAFT_148937 [Colletotrichum acutatum]KAK1728090.1 hypothetical protein BDZ83DRAFT_148937 [Colletotrichum acutatum]